MNIPANITEQQTVEAAGWASERLGRRVSGEQAVEYVAENYPGGWFMFVRDVCFPSAEQAPGLSEEDRRLCRRDTKMENGITFREYLNGRNYAPDSWEVFQHGVRVGWYKTERAALRRIERLNAENSGA